MAQEDIRLSGTFLNSSGNALASKTATLYREGTVTPAIATDTTDSDGEWDLTATTPGRYDVQLVSGTETIRILARDKFQVTEIQARNPTTAQPALSAYSTTSEAASLVATFGFRPSTESSGVETADTPSDGDLGYIDFTLSNDHSSKQEWIAVRIAWEGVDVSDGSEDGQFNFWAMTNGTLVEELHLSGAALWPEADAGLDLGTSALGFNDLHLGSGGVVNFDGGDVTLTHASNALTLAGGTFTVSGNTVLNGDVTLGDAAGDVITINGTVAGADAVVFEGATGNTNETTLNITNPTADATIKLPAMSAGTYFLPVLDTASSVAVSATPDELNILDGATVVVGEINYLDLGSTAVGTAIASKAVILDSNKDYDGLRNLTITGELDAATLDLSSSADIAGDLVLSGGADGALQFTNAGENSIKIPDNQASALIIEEANNAYVTFVTTDSSESVTFGKAVDLGSNTLTTTGSLQVRTIDYSDGDNAITIADGGGTTFAAAVDLGSNTLTSTGSLQVQTIDYSDGDLAMTIADGGGVTFAQDATLTSHKYLNLPENSSIKFTDQIGVDNSIDNDDGQGIIFTFRTGATVTPFSPVYIDGNNEVQECNANAIATMPCIGVSMNTSNVTADNDIEVMMLGLIRHDSFSDFGAAGAPVYASGTAGALTTTAPSGEDDVVQIVGHSIAEDLIFVQPCLTTIEHTG